MQNEYASRGQEKRARAAMRRHADALGTSVDTRLMAAIDTLLPLDHDAPGHDEAYSDVLYWMYASYECEGYTARALERMDVTSAANALIERRRSHN